MKTTNKHYDRLKELKEGYPELTFNNKGYEKLSQEIQERNKEPIAKISEILTETLDGFVKFNNFKERADGSVVIRVQYHWDLSFVGVGYFDLNLWKNFEYNEKI